MLLTLGFLTPQWFAGETGQNELKNNAFEKKEVDKIIVNPEQRRVDLHWVEKVSPSRWLLLPEQYNKWAYRIAEERNRSRRSRYRGLRERTRVLKVPNDGVLFDVPSDEIAVKAFADTYLVSGTEVAAFARKCLENVQHYPSHESVLVALTILYIIADQIDARQAPNDVESVRKSVREFDSAAFFIDHPKQIEDLFDIDEFALLLMRSNWKTFDPSVWKRNYLF